MGARVRIGYWTVEYLDTDLLRTYRWWTISCSRGYLKLGPLSVAWYLWPPAEPSSVAWYWRPIQTVGLWHVSIGVFGRWGIDVPALE